MGRSYRASIRRLDVQFRLRQRTNAPRDEFFRGATAFGQTLPCKAAFARRGKLSGDEIPSAENLVTGREQDLVQSRDLRWLSAMKGLPEDVAAAIHVAALRGENDP
jgi:hypothetical protein